MPRTQQVARDPEDSMPTLLRMRTVIRVTGLARSTNYRLIAEKQFPGQVRLGKRAVAWRRADLARWSEERPPAAES